MNEAPRPKGRGVVRGIGKNADWQAHSTVDRSRAHPAPKTSLRVLLKLVALTARRWLPARSDEPDLLSACRTSQQLIAHARRPSRDSITPLISDAIDEAQIALQNAVDAIDRENTDE